MSATADRTGGSRGRMVAAVAGGLVAVAVVVAALLLSGGEEDVAGALDRAFAAPIPSAEVRLDAELRVDGSPRLPTPLRLRVAGPYRDGGARTVPVFAQNVLLTGSGRTFATRLLSTGENAFVVFQGIPYEVGAAAVADANRQIASGPRGSRSPTVLGTLGLDPRRWLVEPEDRGEESLAGETTEHYAARVDAVRLLEDLQAAAERAAPRVGRRPPPPLTDAQRDSLRGVFAGTTLDAYVGETDGRLRQLVLRAPFAVPPESRAQAGGATGGLLYISLGFSRIGQPVRVSAPPNPRPIEDLRNQIGPLGGR